MTAEPTTPIPTLDQMRQRTTTLPKRRQSPPAATPPPKPLQPAPVTPDVVDPAAQVSDPAPKAKPTKRNVPRADEATRGQINIHLPTDVIALVNAYCARGRNGRPVTHGAAVIEAMIATQQALPDLLSEGPARSEGGWVLEDEAPASSGGIAPWTCQLHSSNRRQLDELARKLGVSRSRLVAAALRAFLS